MQQVANNTFQIYKTELWGWKRKLTELASVKNTT